MRVVASYHMDRRDLIAVTHSWFCALLCWGVVRECWGHSECSRTVPVFREAEDVSSVLSLMPTMHHNWPVQTSLDGEGVSLTMR